MSEPTISINGEFVKKENATVNVYDHGLLYGDGVFEGMRVYNSKVFEHERHTARLYDSARSIMLEIPIPPAEMMDRVNATVARHGGEEAYIRSLVTRGPGSLGLDPRGCVPQIIIIVDSIRLYPAELYQKGLEIVTASSIRNHPQALNPRIKSLNYLNNIMAKMEGIRAGCLEALMLNHKGEVAECTGDNIFILKGGVLKTPPLDAGVLDGITRKVVMELAEEAGVPLAELAMSRHDVYTAEECFLTGTAAEVIPVVKVDGRVVGDGKPGPITQQLREKFMAYARR